MLQAHSLLWHYLFVAPNVLLLVLACFLLRLRFYKLYPAFFAFAVVGAVAELITYAADLAPWVTPKAWWSILWMVVILEGLVKFAVVGELFDHAFHKYAALATLGRTLIRRAGAVFIFASAVAAAFAPPDSRFGIISGVHLLEQAIYLVETGLLVFLFVFAAYFHLRLERAVLGISLGLALSACIHLAVWAVLANGGLSEFRRVQLGFINMAAYHVAVLLWFYYLLVPHQAPVESAVSIPENSLAVWNRELERLLQQ
jgi:hypothetical protein